MESDLRLHADQTAKIEFILSALVRSCGAEAAVLVSNGGQEIAAMGKMNGIDRAAAASLSAGAAAVLSELSRTFGEPEFAGTIHRGPGRTLYLRVVGATALLVVVTGNRGSDTLLGNTIRRAVPLLADILEPSSNGGNPVLVAGGSFDPED